MSYKELVLYKDIVIIIILSYFTLLYVSRSILPILSKLNNLKKFNKEYYMHK